MALMKYREPNQVLWQGVRPAHNGTEVTDSKSKNVAATFPVYTVPVGMTYHLTYAFLCVVSNVNINAAFRVRNDTAVIQYDLLYARSLIGFRVQPQNASFWPPIELPAGWDICLYQSAAFWCELAFSGWYE